MDIKISFDKTAFQCKPTNRQTAFMKKGCPKKKIITILKPLLNA